ncbi:hypothetical protein F8154_05745 [Alkaliphilus pronyensis]|uniref:DUF4320 family protein n=1 Tax=Alkaliphilus pronyensis TaxID=1482732 RepID=A0A6I0FA01_9FIRM|nr:hypothetical protein [Alkaliphilus pronyensis]KAB3535633.1 hypothetical protein F8154_05745 [Alkaliphilus pronyensis]
MQLPGDLLILGFVIVFLVLFFVTGIENTIPAFVRTEFDILCSKYLALLQSEGGISPQLKCDLETELINMGFTNINITAPEDAVWGQEAQLTVTADYIYETTSVTLTKEEVTRRATFNEKTIVMTLD